MFNNLGDRFKDIFKKVSGQGKLTEANMKDALREVRLALLEADVNYGVAKNFVAKIRDKALGEQVITGVNPTQQFIKIVHDELIEVLGGTNVQIAKSHKNPTIVMLAGLQGAGKTTFAGKLAKHLKSKGESPFLIGADVYRPAAKKQLKFFHKLFIYMQPSCRIHDYICSMFFRGCLQPFFTYLQYITALIY